MGGMKGNTEFTLFDPRAARGSTFHVAPRSEGRRDARWAIDAYGRLAALVFGAVLGSAIWVAACAIMDGFALRDRALAG
jgi:hypothetical protein